MMKVAKYKVGDSVRNLIETEDDGSAYLGKVISIFPLHPKQDEQSIAQGEPRVGFSYRTEAELEVGVRSRDISRFGYQVEWVRCGTSNPWGEEEIEAVA